METLFKGYIKTKDKKASERFKDRTDFKTLDDVKDLPEYAGVLADDVVLIDIDDAEQSEILMNIIEAYQIDCRVHQTSRGRHFFFRNSGITKGGNAQLLALGLTADIKIGCKNSYAVLKFAGEERFCEWDIEENGRYQSIPKWLHPLGIAKNFPEFYKMKKGDGRNQTLFNYILTLQGKGFSVEDTRESIHMMNDYVLGDTLDKSEIDTILRDEAFQKPVFFNGNVFLHDKFSSYIQNTDYIKKINNQLHVYKDGIYVSGSDKIENIMIRHIPTLTRAKRSEVLSYLDIMMLDSSDAAESHYIAFRNGIYDIESDTLLPFSPDIMITNLIPWDYNPNAQSEIADRTLNKIACQDSEIRSLLEECIGACFYRSNTLGGGKSFILTGVGSNGKSTYLTMIQNLLGLDNISSLELKELSEKFQNAELFGKLANIGDDISDEFIVNATVFRKLVTGERIQVQRKGETPFEFNNYGKMLFSANVFPRIKDKTGAVQRRLIMIPFDAVFSVNDVDYDSRIGEKLKSQEVMEYLINIGISGLKRVLQTQKYTESKKVKAELEEYRVVNNPILGFIRECEEEEFKFENEPTSDAFRRYNEYCLTNNLQALSKNEFSKQFCRETKFEVSEKRINGKREKIYVKKVII